jgi:hypothetical protein
LTLNEKFALFMESDHYQKYFQEMSQDSYFVARYDRCIYSGEVKLRTALGEAPDIRLKRKDLFAELETRSIKPAATTTWPDLVKLLYDDKFPDPLEVSREALKADLVDIKSFERCLCPCIVNPKEESCVKNRQHFMPSLLPMHLSTINGSRSSSRIACVGITPPSTRS